MNATWPKPVTFVLLIDHEKTHYCPRVHATAAALALSIAPTAGAQSAFSLSSSGSKPAPSGPKNPTPKPGNSTEAKRQLLENFFASNIKKAGAERSAAYDTIAREHIKLAQEGKLEWIDVSVDDYESAIAGAQVDDIFVTVIRYGTSSLDGLGEEFDPSTEVEPVPAGTKAGVATDADDRYVYLAMAATIIQDQPEDY